jgi:hypothetical protein
MRTLTLVTMLSALFGCAGGVSPGSGIEGLTEERLRTARWLYNAELTDVPIAADELVGPQDGFQEVDLRRWGDVIVACDRQVPGKSLGEWRDGELSQDGGEDEIVPPAGPDQGGGDRALGDDVNLQRTNRGRDVFSPESAVDEDGFGMDRFGDEFRTAMDQSDFYVFHPGCA